MEKQVSVYKSSRCIDIMFEDVTFQTRGKKGVKQIIKGVSGKFVSGELTVIMGPSGAGKTSLLNILTGYQVSGTSGTIKCNGSGSKRKKGSLQYKKESCYILQDDNLPPLFTVYEMMMMASNLKIADLSKKSKEYLIEEILNNLGLSVARNTKCQNLSGGQRKRLSVALELVDNPPIMFLDEPTTGLDSSSTSQCVQMLKELARGGRTIICTIHQPSATIYSMFDHVYMMAQGKCVYQGAATNTVAYLSSLGFCCPQYHNPADYFLEVVNQEYGDYTDYLAKAANDEKWRGNVPIIKVGKEIADIQKDIEVYDSNSDKSYKTPSEWTKFKVLLGRQGTQLHRDWTISQLKLFLHLLVGVFLGVFFQNAGDDASKVINNLGLCMIGLVYLSYTSIMPAVLKFPSELAILRKEKFNHWYKLSTYYIAFLVYDIPLQMIFSTAYCTTTYFMSAQPYESFRFFMVLLIQILVALASSAFGLFLGTVVNPVNGTFFGAIALAVMIVLGGFLILFTHMSSYTYFFTYASFFSWGLEGMMQALYGYNRPELPCPDDEDYCHYTSPKVLLSDVGMTKQNYWFDVIWLLVVCCALRLLAFCTLRRQLKAA
ncbi:unnamed protein product [Callosobruchus maculatus]|uniref:ABC transporter domain-containing protein n=1 Tax=Callosobruchus maculatus TaxID=64391 RepID=A0A653C3F5_CALMS|nr:unnamed protein product [Callosobruchus maculatus]